MYRPTAPRKDGSLINGQARGFALPWWLVDEAVCSHFVVTTTRRPDARVRVVAGGRSEAIRPKAPRDRLDGSALGGLGALRLGLFRDRAGDELGETPLVEAARHVLGRLGGPWWR